MHQGDGQIATGRNGQPPIYQKLGCHYGYAAWWPVVDDKRADHPARDADGVPELRKAVRLALSCRRTQQDNHLYVNDMVDWTREYLAHVFNWATLNAYDAFKGRRLDEMKNFVSTARTCLRLIDSILSTRPDFSLHRQIERVMKVPGTNPHTPWYIKKHCVNDLYSNNEVYEQLHWFYGPRMEIYFSELEKRAAEGVNTITWGQIADRCGAIERRWLNEGIAVPEKDRFAGTTMEAVVAAVKTIKPHVSKIARRAAYPVSPWPEEREVKADYRATDVHQGLRERSWADGPLERMKGFVRSPGGDSGKSRYLYFQVNDNWCLRAPADPPMNLVLDVRTAKPAKFDVEYDSHDSKATLRGAYTLARPIGAAADAPGTVRRFHLPGAYFANRQNGACDLRLILRGPTADVISVRLGPATPAERK